MKGISNHGLWALPLLAPASATLLYVSSYAGTVTTLNLDGSSLTTVATSRDCGSSPSWLELNATTLYCVNEGFTDNGSVSSLKTNADGSLVKLDQLDILAGPVSSIIYGTGKAGIALAHYGGSAFTTLNGANPADLALVSNVTFVLDHPSPNPDRQEAPHPHQALLDPTGQYILVPDLGADLVRVFRVTGQGLATQALAPLVAAPGSGPRHVTFVRASRGRTFMYLISELSNSITGYEVSYRANKTVGFKELFVIPTHGAGSTVPAGTKAAEITVSPDGNFLIASSRNENSFTIPNFDTTNSTQIPSDVLINFQINRETGALKHLQDVPSGGRFPRQFSYNKDGSRVAVGLQSDGRVVVIARDVKTGQLGDFVANAAVAGEVTSVIWSE